MKHLETLGIKPKGKVNRNLDVDTLIKKAVERKEGVISKNGALTVKTGKYTGRSPDDRFVVDSPEFHDEINWGKVNVPISEENFDKLYKKITEHLSNKDELFVFDGAVGADPDYSLNVRIVTENASHSLFAQNMFIRLNDEQIKNHHPEVTVLQAPGCHADPKTEGTNSEAFIILNLKKKVVIIGATSYAGEIKKSIFSFMNWYLPKKDVFPMHCSANIGKDETNALFFGLSGTGKTTLSADPNRRLIGDDEHGWSKKGIFNFEGGCYAKCIKLSKEREPQIWNAIKKGALVENVVMDPKTLEYDYDDESITENTRASYPIDFIPNAELSGVGGHPKTVVFLTADAFGVMPPVAKLTKEQAMYHFMAGYTSKLAGTERGIIEPLAAFSSFFGAPFMPLKPMVYADLLAKYTNEHKSSVYLINTGWSGGPYGVGERISLPHTRAIVTAALDGSLEKAKFRKDPIFNVMVPESCPGVPSEILDPVNTWKDKEEYKKKANELAALFVKNFEKFKDVPEEVKNAGPSPS